VQKKDISETIFISGNVFPVKEIEIKSQISGILEEIFVHIGNYIQEDEPIASIKLVPNTADIERLESNVNIAQIEYNVQYVEYKRIKKIYENKLISQSEMDIANKNFLLAKENLNSARNQLDIMQKGHISSKNVSNIVKSSTRGTVIDLPSEIGTSVIERNNYNARTTIAIVAETNLFKFRTLVPEQYLKNISLKDSISLSFNAYPELKIKACVTKISSKGNSENGIMKYMLDAEFLITPDMPVLRSGYSATAEITLNSRRGVNAIEEKYFIYQNDSVYLYVDVPGESPNKRNVNIGISDGIHTEIVSGIDPNEQIVTNYDQIK
jgi:HlyD family secretion protein